MACTRGVRLVSRSGWRASTSLSKGTSSWAKASSTVSLTRSSSSPKASSGATSVRRTTVLTRKPTTCSKSLWPRAAAEVPSAMSRWPDQRARTALTAAVSAMNRLAPRCRASALSPAVVAAGTVKRRTAPAESRTAGRGRSVGSSSGAIPFSCSRHQVSCSSS